MGRMYPENCFKNAKARGSERVKDLGICLPLTSSLGSHFGSALEGFAQAYLFSK